MNTLYAVDILRMLITTSILIVAPILAVSMLVGLIVSLIQTVTSIQEQTMTFVPKLLAVAGVLVFAAPWMLRHLMQFTISFIERMPQMVR